MQGQVDLDLLPYGESEDMEVNIQPPETETQHTEERPSNKGGQTVELSSDDEEEIWTDPETSQGEHGQGEEMETPFPKDISSDTTGIINQPIQPQTSGEDLNSQVMSRGMEDVPVNIKIEPVAGTPPQEKRGYNRRPLPPAREPRIHRSAFQSASEKLAASYKRKK